VRGVAGGGVGRGGGGGGGGGGVLYFFHSFCQVSPFNIKITSNYRITLNVVEDRPC